MQEAGPLPSPGSSEVWLVWGEFLIDTGPSRFIFHVSLLCLDNVFSHATLRFSCPLGAFRLSHLACTLVYRHILSFLFPITIVPSGFLDASHLFVRSFISRNFPAWGFWSFVFGSSCRLFSCTQHVITSFTLHTE